LQSRCFIECLVKVRIYACEYLVPCSTNLQCNDIHAMIESSFETNDGSQKLERLFVMLIQTSHYILDTVFELIGLCNVDTN
jgi:hypothetical protein